MAAQDLEGLLKGLKKLRVLHVNFRNREKILLPACIGEMKLLRYIFFTGDIIRVTLPPAFGKLYHLQKFGAPTCCLGFSADKQMSNLTNLRYMHTMNTLDFPNVGRLKLLRTLNTFTMRTDTGYEIQQLEHLNSIRGHLLLYGLEAIKSKEEAGQATLANKVYVSHLELEWSYGHESSNSLVENQEEGRTRDPPGAILEALRPPLELTSLSIRNYHGSTYPSWLSGQRDTLENLQYLHFSNCNGSDAPPKLRELRSRLCNLSISDCSWNSLPDNMEHLKSLEELNIMSCKNILSLPKLPVSLERLSLMDWNGSDTPPKIGELLVKLHRLQISSCSWNSLPENMELLTSLEELAIDNCENILLLPTLPRSLKKFELVGCRRQKYCISTDLNVTWMPPMNDFNSENLTNHLLLFIHNRCDKWNTTVRGGHAIAEMPMNGEDAELRVEQRWSLRLRASEALRLDVNQSERTNDGLVNTKIDEIQENANGVDAAFNGSANAESNDDSGVPFESDIFDPRYWDSLDQKAIGILLSKDDKSLVSSCGHLEAALENGEYSDIEEDLIPR
ncbi:hypothetical protein PR202_ga30286 [Eleusine coracana subsp. coracana]|uniref:R13L1/DRL21-like LRR repeat region domain-containing protein n=1 Tax=Eleusine coracana subsp. coracana TaxID=191504 RepID=A0AAV5DM46_ELECO|nr:hypothetical protein PR202_ga30286 [Eleusine coracana subsp. coracana]